MRRGTPNAVHAALDYLAPLPLLAVAPLGGVALLPNLAWMLPVLLCVLVDLRFWWTAAIVVAVIARFDERLGSLAAGPWQLPGSDVLRPPGSSHWMPASFSDS